MSGSEPESLSLEELRSERAALQAEEDAVSYVRRLAQGRLDLARAERRQRLEARGELADALTDILTPAMSGGSARPPRETHADPDHPLVLELDAQCDQLGFDRLEELDDDQLAALESALAEFEHACSSERHVLFQRIDALTAELVRRYRSGDATVDALLDG